IADYTEAIRLDATDADHYYMRGLTYCQMGEFAKAIPDLTESIRIEPSAAAYMNRATAHGSTGRNDLALADCTAAIRLDVNEPFFYENRAAVYRKMGDEAKAVADT